MSGVCALFSRCLASKQTTNRLHRHRDFAARVPSSPHFLNHEDLYMADTSNAFSNSGEEAISRRVDVDLQEILEIQDIEQYFEIERVAAEIVQADYKRVSLRRTILCSE